LVASEKAQQAPESEIATTVDKSVAKENINTDESDIPKQKKLVQVSIHKKITIRDHSS
jgi:hypothetical protein